MPATTANRRCAIRGRQRMRTNPRCAGVRTRSSFRLPVLTHHRSLITPFVVGPVDGEYLVGIRDPRLEERRVVGLVATQLVHGADETEPVEHFMVSAVLDFAEGSAAPQLPIA